MVEILAIVKRSHAAATRQELSRIGCAGYTQWPVLGRGRQRGLRDANRQGTLPFLPKVLFEIVVEDAQAPETVEAVIRANQTGGFGDGKIFVLPLEAAHWVSAAPNHAAASAPGGV